MKPEQLLVLASARGIRLDLGRPKRDIPYSSKRPPKRRDVRRPTGEDPGDPGIPGVITADGKQDRSSKAPEWTATDLGHAAAGMPLPAWNALSWCIALDEKARGWLKWRLFELALELREREAWPKQFRRKDCAQCGAMRCQHKYIEDLCNLVLLEGAYPQIYGNEATRAEYFGLSETHWRRAIGKGYQLLRTHMTRWYEDAQRHLARRLREIEEEWEREHA